MLACELLGSLGWKVEDCCATCHNGRRETDARVMLPLGELIDVCCAAFIKSVAERMAFRPCYELRELVKETKPP